LSAAGWQESAGKTPRFFALDPTGRRMFVANEDSDTIVAFDVDRETGSLTNVGTAAHVGSPTCILFRVQP
jgi:6-phosphogluconolactonase (cycloisomerase 2 family)